MLLESAEALPELIVWSDPTPREAALNMAIDEVLLHRLAQPWLRAYDWAVPSISIGFSQPLTKIPASKRHFPVVRRWTGGGVVVHEGDWTYTLGVPAHIPFSDEKAGEIYRWIHEKMVAAFEALGVTGAELQPNHTSDGMGVCFVEPAKFDVVWQDHKIAGAAQRRNKLGLMHQGTIQEVPIPEGFLEAFSARMCSKITVMTELPEEWLREAEDLASSKYASDSWTLEKTVTPKA